MMNHSISNSITQQLHEYPERSSNFFYKNKYAVNPRILISADSQLEYSREVQFMLVSCFFYSNKVIKFKFKNKVLSTGSGKKEQVHKSSLRMSSLIINKKYSIFSSNFSHFFAIMKTLNSNFCTVDTKYILPRTRIINHNKVFKSFNHLHNVSPTAISRVRKSNIKNIEVNYRLGCPNSSFMGL